MPANSDAFAALAASIRGSRLDPASSRVPGRDNKPARLTLLPAAATATDSSRPAAATARARDRAPGMPPRAATPSHQAQGQIAYSEEQRAIIGCNARHIVADAFAGCGKTATAVGFCEARPSQRILYLVLNTANAAEARQRFPKNVSAMTTHSLAWNSPGMRAHVGTRIDRRWRAMTLMQQFRIANATEAYHAQQVLQTFFGSTDRDITGKHVDALVQARNLSPSHALQALANARVIWKEMLDRNGRCSIPDDAYLKIYALGSPQLDYDTVILDEAQDANPVTAQIVAAQRRSRLLCIGDRHQSIYQFRGSVNAMEQFSVGAERFHLTQTYRFGPAIAAVANTILGELKSEQHRIRGMAEDGRWDPRGVTYLSRTNAQLFALAAQRRGQGIHWVAKAGDGDYVVGRDGPDNYRLSLLADVYHLYARDIACVRDRSLRQMGSFEEYRAYSEAARDGEARVLCKLVEAHAHDTPALIDDIRANAARREEDADIVLTTAHKSKGLEWNCVRICDDFEFLEDLEVDLAANPDASLAPERVQDINLLYVAVTRARSALQLNDETSAWMGNRPGHRGAGSLAPIASEHATREPSGRISGHTPRS